jgi:hypothetical protein
LSELNKKFLDRVCNAIHTNVVNKWDTIPLSLYPYEEDYQDYYIKIYEFILNMLFIDDYENLKEIFLYFIYNYNEGANYSNAEYTDICNDDLLDQFDDRVVIASIYFKTLPFFIEPMEYWSYGEVPVYYILTEDGHYAIGTWSQVMAAMKHEVDDRWYGYGGETGVIDVLGIYDYLMFCEVSDTDKRIISSEESSYYEGDMSDEEVIDYLNDNSNDSELVDEYMELKEKWGELPSSEDGTEYAKRMVEIVYEGREIVRELIYDDIHEKLSDNDSLKDYLWQLGYITKKDGYFSVSPKTKLPSWLSFDWDSFIEEQIDNSEVSDLSPYGNYDTFKWDGDTYYIYRIDY